MIIITGSVQSKPDTHQELVAICIEHSARSRAEQGCIAHNVHVDCENPERLVFLERWADAAAVKAHFAVPASGDFVKNLARLAATPPEMTIFSAEAIPAKALVTSL